MSSRIRAVVVEGAMFGINTLAASITGIKVQVKSSISSVDCSGVTDSKPKCTCDRKSAQSAHLYSNLMDNSGGATSPRRTGKWSDIAECTVLQLTMPGSCQVKSRSITDVCFRFLA